MSDPVSAATSAASSGAARVRAVPVWFWPLAVLALCLGWMIWHRYHQDDEDTDWLDPGQPPLNIGSVAAGAINVVERRTREIAPLWRAPKIYAYGSLMQCRESWIGDA